MVKVQIPGLGLTKVLEWVKIGLGIAPYSGQEFICESLTDPGLKYRIKLEKWGHIVPLVTREYLGFAMHTYYDPKRKTVEMKPGRYKCRLIEYVSQKLEVQVKDGYVEVPAPPKGGYVLLFQQGKVKVYWEGAKLMAYYSTRNCQGVVEGNFKRPVSLVGDKVRVPVKGVVEDKRWFRCVFDFDDSKPVTVYVVNPTVVKEFELNVGTEGTIKPTFAVTTPKPPVKPPEDKEKLIKYILVGILILAILKR